MSFPSELVQNTSTSPPDLPLLVVSPGIPIDWKFFVRFAADAPKNEIPPALRGLRPISTEPYETDDAKHVPGWEMTLYEFSEEDAKIIYGRYCSSKETKRSKNWAAAHAKGGHKFIKRMRDSIEQLA